MAQPVKSHTFNVRLGRRGSIPEAGAEMPSVTIPENSGWRRHRVVKVGEPADILETAVELAAQLIVVTTDGPDGYLDGLHGTTSERSLRNARCSVANLPVGSILG